MAAILTDRHHVKQAIRFLNSTNVYGAIGRTTAWSNESSPPAPDPTATALTEVVCYAPLSAQTLVKPDAGGSIEVNGVLYSAVSEANAYTEGAIRVYVEARFDYDNAPLVTWRQAGFYSGLVKGGGAGSGILLPADVTSPGILETIDNRTPTVRAIDKVDVITAVIQF